MLTPIPRYTADESTLHLSGGQFSIISSYVGQTTITILGTVGTGVWGGTTIAILHGGTGVTSVTTAPTASAWAGWDANENLSANNLIDGYATTVTSGTTITLTVASAYQQYLTGSTAQTVKLPVAATLVEGWSIEITNASSATATVESSGSNTVLSQPALTVAVYTCILNSGTTAASWSVSYFPVSTSSNIYDIFGTSATETARAEAAEALLAPLASPALTGTPTAPTAAAFTDSTQIATTAYADAAAGRYGLNYCINGGMQFQQPLTFNASSSVAYGGPGTNDTYTFDQLKGNTQSAAKTITVTQIAGGPNSPYYSKFSSAGAFGMIQYEVIESFPSLALVKQGATVTAQVQAKMPTGAQKMTIAIIGWSGTADTLTQAMVSSWTSGASTDPTLATNFAVIAKTTTGSALTSSFQQVSVTTTLSTSSGYNNLIVAVWFDSASSVAVEFDVTELGLFVAPGVVPWQQTDTAIEYDRVRRFYELFSGGGIFGFGQCFTGTTGAVAIAIYPKRIVPTLLAFSALSTFRVTNAAGGAVTPTGMTTGPVQSTVQTEVAITAASGLAAGSATFLYTGASGASGGMIAVGAQL